MKKNNKNFIVKAIASGTIVSLTNQEGHYKQRSQRRRITKQVFVYYHVFEISGNSKGGQVPKRKEHQNFIPFYILLSFLVCINTDSKVQTGATLFKTALKVELFSCFDGRPITRARKKILRPAPFEIRRRTFLKVC